MLLEAIDDVDLLHADLLANTARAIRLLNRSDLVYRTIRYEADRMSDLLEDLLLTQPGASTFLFSVYDQFHDLAKVDQANTTARVDTEEGKVTLNPNEEATIRIRFSHLIDQEEAEISLDRDVLVSATVPGSQFGNAFDDLLSGEDVARAGFCGPSRQRTQPELPWRAAGWKNA